MRASLVLANLALATVAMLPWGSTVDAAGKGSMDIQQRHEIEHATERLVYTFLRLFEGEHSKTPDLMTKDVSVQFLPGEPTVGRETLREAYTRLEEIDTNLNVLIASNLVTTAIDQSNATGFCYVTHFRHTPTDSEPEGQAILRAPNSITGWSWEFKRVEDEWKVSKLHAELILLNEAILKDLEDLEATSE